MAYRFAAPWVLILLAAALVLTPFAANAQRRVADVDFDRLTLRLAGPSKELVLLEPVPLTITLENRTGRGVLGHSLVDFSTGRVDVQIARPGLGPHFVDQLSTETGFDIVGQRVIQPGERHESTEMLIVGLDTEMPVTGTYSIRIRLKGFEPGEEVWSNKLHVRVREPQGLEKEAYDYVIGTGWARTFLTGMIDGGARQVEEELERFADLYPDTPYGDYAAFALGRIHAVGHADKEKARSYLVRVANKPEFQRWRESAPILEQVGLKRRKD